MTAPPFLAEQVALLERTPGVVRTLLAGLPDSWLDERDTPNGWQARDVAGPLISAELSDWIPRAEIIEEHGTSRPFDPFDRFEMLERDRGVPLDNLIDRFAELRQAKPGPPARAGARRDGPGQARIASGPGHW